MRHNMLVLALVLFTSTAAIAQHKPEGFRVCADPNNLPFSNAKGEGFENKLAVLLAHDLGERLSFVFQRQTDNFLNRGLNAHLCDAVMGLPVGLDEVAVTRPYYASAYVFVTRGLRITTLTDPRLRHLRIGVHLVGDEPTPPTEVLGREGIVNNVKGFMISGGDYGRPNPPGRLIEAVSNKTIDVAAAWGPIGGYFAKSSPIHLTVTPITGTKIFEPLAFKYSIAIGVRKEDASLRARLDWALARERRTINTLLQSYGIPLVSPRGLSHD
jgi:quinoprotein dehydrogenase-associated probable ABC transporter substrate-binding protein